MSTNVVDIIFKKGKDILKEYLMEYSSLCIILLDKKFRIIHCNKGFLDLVGLEEAPLEDLLSNYLPDGSSRELFSLLQEKDPVRNLRVSLWGKGDHMYILEVDKYSIEDTFLIMGEVKTLSGSEIVEEFTVLNNELTNMVRELNKKNNELKKANDTITRLMQIDYLTEIYNRRFFMEALEKALSLFNRHGHSVSIVAADLDDFKRINDSYGHNIGDQVLVEFSGMLQELSREEDTPARVGGEEFSVLLPSTAYEDALKYAEKVRKAWNEKKVSPLNESLSASFGVTQLRQGDNVDAALKRADEALYRAKEKGKNRVEGDGTFNL